jgi:hypothetical protein
MLPAGQAESGFCQGCAPDSFPRAIRSTAQAGMPSSTWKPSRPRLPLSPPCRHSTTSFHGCHRLNHGIASLRRFRRRYHVGHVARSGEVEQVGAQRSGDIMHVVLRLPRPPVIVSNFVGLVLASD